MSTLRSRVVKTHQQRGAQSFRLDVNAEFSPGVTAIFGASGSGKSTWLECIAGLQRPDQGEVALDGEAWFDHAGGMDVPPRRRGIGYLFQSAALFPHLTIRANVEYGLHDVPRLQRRSIAQRSLDAFHINHLADKRADGISGGERQRVSLARALVRNPRCLLLDEPFSALDLGAKTGIMDDILAWNRERPVPVLLVTHALEEVLAMAERVVVVELGRIVAEGRPREVLAQQRDQLVSRLKAAGDDLLS